MAEFDLPFASKLADLANKAMEESSTKYANRRAALYLSRLACEVATKALLEAAGTPVKDIEKRRHNIPALLQDLWACEVNLAPYAEADWVSADIVAKEHLDYGFFTIPILDLIDVSGPGYSKFPNEIRYGETVFDVHPMLLAEAAVKFCAWAELFEWRIRRRQLPPQL